MRKQKIPKIPKISKSIFTKNESNKIISNMSNNMPNNIPNNTSNNTPDNTPNNTPNNTPDNTPNNTPNNIPNDISNQINDTYDSTLNSIFNNTLNNTLNNTSNNTLNNTLNNTSDNMSKLDNLDNDPSISIDGSISNYLNNISDNKMKESIAKKRPGRPKKTIINVPVEIRGIVNKPVNEENVLEVVYQNPKIFKKIFSLDKAYEANEICIDFSPSKFIIMTKNHTGTIIKRCIFNCNRLNHFYCKENMEIDIKREMIEKIFRTLDKPHYKITFVLKEDFKSMLYIYIKDFELECEHQYGIELIQKVQRPDESQFNISGYPISFNLPSKSFKRLINDFDSHSDILTIIKNGTDPLQLTYEEVKKITLSTSYNNSDKINLKSTIKDDDILSVSIHTSNIKPFSNASIGDIVYITVDKNKPICFSTKLDKISIEKQDGTYDIGYVCEVSVLSEIKKY